MAKRLSDLEKKEIERLYNKGLSIFNISCMLNRDKGTVKRYVEKMGLVKPKKEIVDLTSQVYGRLTVVELDHIKRSVRYWKCSCQCGGTAVVREGNLKSGITRSCGCLKKEHKTSKITTKQVKTRYNQGGVYYFQPGEIVLKGNYEGEKKCGSVKQYKLSPEELAAYLKELEHKKVKRRGE